MLRAWILADCPTGDLTFRLNYPTDNDVATWLAAYDQAVQQLVFGAASEAFRLSRRSR